MLVTFASHEGLLPARAIARRGPLVLIEITARGARRAICAAPSAIFGRRGAPLALDALAALPEETPVEIEEIA